VHHVLAGLAELPARADAEPAVCMLAEAGISMACLSNGTAEASTVFLARTELTGYVGPRHQCVSGEPVEAGPAGLSTTTRCTPSPARSARSRSLRCTPSTVTAPS
jgi:hypothetical protein